ncbi:hypothetical protein V1477_002374 [Vespula maculifrons]|uniref:Uncharacterized protein n=1 Tax=Vespula maculifrons TaxID=7453 RepID=A0ABD2CXG4_VESMC
MSYHLLVGSNFLSEIERNHFPLRNTGHQHQHQHQQTPTSTLTTPTPTQTPPPSTSAIAFAMPMLLGSWPLELVYAELRN